MHIADRYDFERLFLAHKRLGDGAINRPHDRVHIVVIAVSQGAQYGEEREMKSVRQL